MSFRKNFLLTAASVALLGASGMASAVPQLQLGIDGGTYDSGSETIIASSNPFTLYSFLTINGSKEGGGNKTLSLTDSLYMSIALIPKVDLTDCATPASCDFGSFKIGDTTINVTANMIYGTPPLDSATTADGAALPGHDIFKTYFYQTAAFNFTGATQYNQLNTQDDPDLSGLTAGEGGMYGLSWLIDTTNLDSRFVLHFDLYNTELAKCTGKPDDEPCPIDYDAAAFAPFSHDAQSSSSSGTSTTGDVPEPNSSSLALLGLAMLGTAFGMRRRKLNG